ncbi:MAG: hypothetical protein AB7V23_15850, partial [Candidatus Nanopelagicales bacterium]
MTYQPERDGYGVSSDRAAATEDDRPVVIEDDGTRRTADDMSGAAMRRDLRDDPRVDGMGTP